MRAAAELFLDEMSANHPPRWLTMIGESGVGKTHSARAIYRAARGQLELYKCPRLNITQRRTFLFLNWTTACARMRSGEHGLVEYMAEMDLLVIDDLGAEYDPSGYVSSQLYRIIDSRMGKWTVLTSNLTLADIAGKVDQRAADRMIRDGNKVLTVDTKSFSMR